MALITQLDDGRWKAVLRGADGRRRCMVEATEAAVREWATVYEGLVRSGDPLDRPATTVLLPARPETWPELGLFHEPGR